jgi:hypothetical protein
VVVKDGIPGPAAISVSNLGVGASHIEKKAEVRLYAIVMRFAA